MALSKRSQNLWQRYRVTEESYNRLLSESEGKCGICGREDKKLNVDHCHETDEIRGLLCTPCNTALAAFGDNLEGIGKAIEYLKRHDKKNKDPARSRGTGVCRRVDIPKVHR